MNLAFPALLIFILIAPGIVWRAAYMRGSWSESIESSSLPAMLLWGIFAGSCFHLFWGMISWRIGHPIDLHAVISLLTLKPDDGVARALNVTAASPLRMAAYFLSQLGAAHLFGHWASKLVRAKKWDLAYEWLRFDNEWYYLLTGRLSLLRHTWSGPDVPKIPDAVYASVVIDSGGVAQLYYGCVAHFIVGKDGHLDRLLLANSARRELSEDRQPDREHCVGGGDDYYQIEGDYLVVPYEQIKNLNIEYVWLEEQADQAMAELSTSNEGGK
ncbi:hypothetical protein LCGC14_1437780 [marine sediment metagenome]|uniref:Uncharacterized protein n=1 Tax=marine sediment metagenome TaxID=412755 RepID=A0A0F9JM58_9ZZZZ